MPYNFHVYKNVPALKSRLNRICLTSFGYAVFFLVMGFWDFKRRRNEWVSGQKLVYNHYF